MLVSFNKKTCVCVCGGGDVSDLACVGEHEQKPEVDIRISSSMTSPR